jgi:hypothetical protein
VDGKLMKELTRTTTAGVAEEAHYHILYLNDEVGGGVASVANGHTHEVQYQAPAGQMVDETGAVTQEATPGGWFVLPAEDGHSHEVTAYVPVKKRSASADEVETVSEVLTQCRVWRELEKDSIERGRESWKFYKGEQWEDDLRSKLKGLSRACLTINQIVNPVDTILGYQGENRTDIKYAPFSGGDGRTADLYSIVVKNILEQCYYEREEGSAFKDNVIAGRGVLNLSVNFDRDMRGNPFVERFPWDQIVFSPHEKSDLSDCEGLVKHKLYSLTRAKDLWPDKADEIEGKYNDFSQRYPATAQFSDDEYSHLSGSMPAMLDSTGDVKVYDTRLKEVRVFERWIRRYIKTPIAVNVQDDVFQNLTDWSSADLLSVRTLPGFTLVYKTTPKIRITKVAGHCLLSDEDPADLPVDDFFVAPMYAYKYEGDFWGKVEALKDPQREVNKRRSQIADIGDRMITSAWMYDETTFVDSQEAKKFEKNISTPGAVFKVANANNPPRQIETNGRALSDLVQMVQFEKQLVSEVANIQVTEGGANTSEAALLERHKRKLAGNEFMFDSLEFAKKRIGRLILGVVRKYYTPERIYRIVSDKNQKAPQQVGGVPFEEYTKDEIIEILSNIEVDKYDVAVSEAAYGPTARMATYALLSDMAANGAPVPPDVVIRLSDIPEKTKQEILDSMAQQSQSQGAAQSETSKMEITKTLIAQGYIPPEVAQQYGITPGQPSVAPEAAPPPQPEGLLEGSPVEAMSTPQASQQPINVNVHLPSQAPVRKRIVINTDPTTGQRIAEEQIVEEDPNVASV